jgi:hypothetical protein
METYSTEVASVASGTDKTLINLFNPAATPTARGGISFLTVGGTGTVGDNQATFLVNRTTAVGTEGSGLVPNNVDPGGPAGAYDSGLGVFSVEPTYTAAKQLLRFTCHHRNYYQWQAMDDRSLLMMTATQNNGANVRSTSSTSTQAYSACILFKE